MNLKSFNFKAIIFVCGLITILSMSGCKHQPIVPDSPAISFANDISPLLIGNCTRSGCHGVDGREFSLITYSEVIRKVSPGNVNSSELYTVIKDKSMPPDKPMQDADVQKIYIWIMQGAKNN